MGAKGFGLLVFLVLYWQDRPGYCLPGGEIAVHSNDRMQSRKGVDMHVLRQEVQELSHLIAAFLALPQTETTRVCRPPYVELAGRCLVVEDENSGSWHQMQDHCNNLGGKLLKVDDANFMADLIQYINANKFRAARYWIGATDLDHKGNWRWPDGSPVRMGTPFWGDYGNAVQQPDIGIPEHCVNMPRDDRFFFHNGPCSEVNSAICEY